MRQPVNRVPPPQRLVAAMADLCRREGLDASETAGVLCVALTWLPGIPRDPAPLLRQYTLAA